jgi:DNA-binding MarR family transcriptional regulator
MPNPPQKIDRNALHRVLYRRSDRNHRLKLDVRALSREMEVDYINLTRIIKGFNDQGRLRRIGGANNGPKVYVVEDPAHWENAS